MTPEQKAAIREAVARAMYEADMARDRPDGNWMAWDRLVTLEPQQYEIPEYRERADAAIAAFLAAAEAQGFVLAPAEPTLAMLEGSGRFNLDRAGETYRAMLAVRPR